MTTFTVIALTKLGTLTTVTTQVDIKDEETATNAFNEVLHQTKGCRCAAILEETPGMFRLHDYTAKHERATLRDLLTRAGFGGLVGEL
jgi:hypothetical protein